MKSTYSGKDPKQEAIDWGFQTKLGFTIWKEKERKVEKKEGERKRA